MGSQVIAGGVVVGEVVETVVALVPGATVALNMAAGNIFTLVPAQATTINASNVTNGETVRVVLTTSGTSSYVVTFGTGFKSTGTQATGTVDAKTFVVTFVAVGGALVETGRIATGF